MPNIDELNIGDGPLSETTIENVLELKRLEVEEKKRQRKHAREMARLKRKEQAIEFEKAVELEEIRKKKEIEIEKEKLKAKEKERDNSKSIQKLKDERKRVTITFRQRSINEFGLFGLILGRSAGEWSTRTITVDSDSDLSAVTARAATPANLLLPGILGSALPGLLPLTFRRW